MMRISSAVGGKSLSMEIVNIRVSPSAFIDCNANQPKGVLAIPAAPLASLTTSNRVGSCGYSPSILPSQLPPCSVLRRTAALCLGGALQSALASAPRTFTARNALTRQGTSQEPLNSEPCRWSLHKITLVSDRTEIGPANPNPRNTRQVIHDFLPMRRSFAGFVAHSPGCAE